MLTPTLSNGVTTRRTAKAASGQSPAHSADEGGTAPAQMGDAGSTPNKIHAHTLTLPDPTPSATDTPPIHVTRRRSGSVVKRPRHLDSPSPSPPPPRLPVPTTDDPPVSAVPVTKSPHATRRTTITSLTQSADALAPPPSLSTPASSTLPALVPPSFTPKGVQNAPLPSTSSSLPPTTTPIGTPLPPATITSNLPSAPLPPPPPPTPMLDPSIVSKHHPRNFVPSEKIRFPTPVMLERGCIQEEDLENKLLMAICAVIHSHENRALCPKEISTVMVKRGWLPTGGNFSHISRCIRDHLKRCATSIPATRPLLARYGLVGQLEDSELHAIGLSIEQQPAVRRGTFWFLDEKVFGKDVGAEDPFVRARREAGLKPLPRRKTPPLVEYRAPEMEEDDVIMIREQLVETTVTMAQEEEEDDSGMGRGKRKRRASAALAATTELLPSLSTSGSQPLAIPSSSSSHNRRSSGSTSSSAPAKYSNFSSLNGSSGVPRLRLRLSNVVEVESSMDDEDGGQNSDANRRRKNKKKARRAASEGGNGRRRGVEMERATSANSLGTASVVSGNWSGSGSASGSGDENMEDVDLGDVPRRRSTAFSAASSSALIQRTLLAVASTSSTPTTKSSSKTTTSSIPMPSPTTTLVAPGLLHFGQISTRPSFVPSQRQQQRINRGMNGSRSATGSSRITLSVSAPHLFSSSNHGFSAMDVDSDDPTRLLHRARRSTLGDSGDEEELLADEDDFHEAMLRGEDFDFEWGSESYGGPENIVAATATTSVSIGVSTSTDASAPILPLSQSNLASSTSSNHSNHSAASKPMDTQSNTSSSHDKQESRESSPGPIGLEGLDFNVKEEEGLDNVSTPATTPREESGELNGEVGVVSATGMEATLCEALGNELVKDDDDEVEANVLLVRENEELDRVESTESLTSLVVSDVIETEVPLSAVRLVADPTVLSMPLPSPLALELPTTHPLNASSFSPDYDFVGHEEDDRSNYRNHYEYIAEADDEEDEEDEDDMVTVKIEDDSGSIDNSARSSRQSSVYPVIDSFSRRLLAEHSSSSSDASSDSDAFEIVSNSLLLASGLPVPQAAPSPPSESADWGMHLDLDDLDIDLGNDEVDLLGPESVGLEELDLAWGGPSEQGPDETLAEWRSRTSKERNGILTSTSSTSLGAEATDGKLRVAKGGTFLTGSPVDAGTPLVSPKLGVQLSQLPPLPLPAIAAPLSRVPSTAATSSSSSSPRPYTPPVTVYPKVPLVPTVTATIVQLAVAVYSVELADISTSITCPLLRRIDTDYINGTVLLQATPTSPSERDSILSGILKTFKVAPGETRGIGGVWIPRPAALQIVKKFSRELNHLADFLDDDLGFRFPEPIPSLRCKLREGSQKHSLIGFPVFQGTTIEPIEEREKGEQMDVVGAEQEGEEEEEVVPIVVVAPKRRGRRRVSVSSSPEVIEPTRRSRRSLAASGV